MTSHSVWTLAVPNAVAASVLLVAAAAKLVSARQAVLAIRELYRRAPRELVAVGVRAFAVVEVVAAVTLLVAGTRVAGALLVGALGLGFASLGVVGWARRSRVACGCFGRPEGRPLGPANAALGVALALVVPLDVAIGLPSGSAHDYSRVAPIAAALGSLALCAWIQRRVVLTLLRPARRAAQGAAS